MCRFFDHEKLEVYRAALAFVDWLEPLVQKVALIKSNSDYRLHEGNVE